MPRSRRHRRLNKKLFWIYALSSSVYFAQGIEGLPSQALFYHLKETLNFSPQKIMVLSSIITAAWLIKPVIGYLVDNLFSKRVWIFLALTSDVALVSVIGLAYLPIVALVTCLLLNSTNAAFRDVSVDGIMCVEGKKSGITGKIQSVQWISVTLSGLLTGSVGGYIAQHWGYQMGFICLIPFYLVVAVAAYFYREEKKANELQNSAFLSDLKTLLTDKKLLIVGLFIFLYKYSPSFGTPLFFIQRDTFKWSKAWIGNLASISTVFQVLGALLYYKYSKRINVKKWLFWSVFVGALTSLSYLYYTPVTAVVYDIIYSFVGMFIFIMVMDFMAQRTMKGYETTSFALLCSISNLATHFAGPFSGALLLPVIGPKWLIVISALTSFLCLPLIRKI